MFGYSFIEWISGECQCHPGWIGPNCSTVCPMGTYGVNCSMQCECLNGGTCHPYYGTCNCPPGFFGSTCSESTNHIIIDFFSYNSVRFFRRQFTSGFFPFSVFYSYSVPWSILWWSMSAIVQLSQQQIHLSPCPRLRV